MTKELLKEFIWHRVKAIEDYDPDERRKDMAAAWIEWDQFETEGEYGWALYPLIPLFKFGSMDWMSLLPLHWQNARSHGENFPYYDTCLTLASKNAV